MNAKTASISVDSICPASFHGMMVSIGVPFLRRPVLSAAMKSVSVLPGVNFQNTGHPSIWIHRRARRARPLPGPRCPSRSATAPFTTTAAIPSG